MLEISITDQQGTRVLSFVRSLVTVGRAAGADIVLDRPGVAARHIQFACLPGALRVYDMRRPMREALVVEPADVVRVAGIDLRARITPTIPPERGAEATLLASIRACPDDAATRAVYADALEERGQRARAEFLRAQLAADTERLVQLAPQVGEGWRAVVAVAPVDGCADSVCPRRWDKLVATDRDDVRTCRVCRSEIRYCTARSDSFGVTRVALDVALTTASASDEPHRRSP